MRGNCSAESGHARHCFIHSNKGQWGLFCLHGERELAEWLREEVSWGAEAMVQRPGALWALHVGIPVLHDPLITKQVRPVPPTSTPIRLSERGPFP